VIWGVAKLIQEKVCFFSLGFTLLMMSFTISDESALVVSLGIWSLQGLVWISEIRCIMLLKCGEFHNLFEFGPLVW